MEGEDWEGCVGCIGCIGCARLGSCSVIGRGVVGIEVFGSLSYLL